MEQSFDAGILEYTILGLFFIQLAIEETITLSMLFYGTIAGIFMFSGRLFVNLAIAEGNAAVAQCLITTFGIWQAGFSLVFDSQPVSLL
jgi:hypothetical protein